MTETQFCSRVSSSLERLLSRIGHALDNDVGWIGKINVFYEYGVLVRGGYKLEGIEKSSQSGEKSSL